MIEVGPFLVGGIWRKYHTYYRKAQSFLFVPFCIGLYSDVPGTAGHVSGLQRPLIDILHKAHCDFSWHWCCGLCDRGSRPDAEHINQPLSSSVSLSGLWICRLKARLPSACLSLTGSCLPRRCCSCCDAAQSLRVSHGFRSSGRGHGRGLVLGSPGCPSPLQCSWRSPGLGPLLERCRGVFAFPGWGFFTSGSGLRHLSVRLDREGPGAWSCAW